MSNGLRTTWWTARSRTARGATLPCAPRNPPALRRARYAAPFCNRDGPARMNRPPACPVDVAPPPGGRPGPHRPMPCRWLPLSRTPTGERAQRSQGEPLRRHPGPAAIVAEAPAACPARNAPAPRACVPIGRRYGETSGERRGIGCRAKNHVAGACTGRKERSSPPFAGATLVQ